jgi:hypothetical protein
LPTALLALALAAGAPNLKDKPPTDRPLVGRWECTALTISGRADPQWRGLEYEFTAAGGWVIYRDGKDLGGVAGRTRPTRRPGREPPTCASAPTGWPSRPCTRWTGTP